MKRCKKIKIHFKKAKPTYLDFYIKKKRTKNGRAQFCKKKRIFRFKIITWDLVSSPSLSNAQLKMTNDASKSLQEKFPEHQVFQVRGLVEGEIINIMKGVDIE